MNFKEWLISEEIFPNKTATVYHRTCQNCNKDESVKAVSSILTSDYKVGKGCYYGCGLYTTFAIESQFTNYMQTYGKAVVKFKVTDLDKYLIFQLSVAKQIHGNDYKMSSQFKKLGLLNKPNVNEGNLKYYDERQEKEKFSSTFAKEFYGQNTWIVNSVKGIIYYGKSDGYCLLKYPTVQDGTITMLGYADSEPNDMKKMEQLKSNIGWIKSVGVLGTSIKNVYKSPIKNKERFAFGDYSYIVDQLLNSKNLEKTAKKLESYVNKLTDENVSDLLGQATDKNKMAEVIVKYKAELSYNNVENLIRYAEYKNKMAYLIIEKKPELSNNNVKDLINAANDKDKMANLIIANKPKLTDVNVTQLLIFATDKEKIAELIIEKQPELSDDNVQSILGRTYKKDKDKIAELIIEKKPELSSNNVASLIYFTINKYKIAELIIEKKPELSDNDVRILLNNADNIDKMAEVIIKYKKELSDQNVSDFLSRAEDKDKIAKPIIEKKSEELSDSNVFNLLAYADSPDEIAELIIEKKPKLSSDNVEKFLKYSIKKDEIAKLLQKETDNISKLSYENVHDLLHNVTDKHKIKMAQIISKYHTKKTPEIQEILDKYLTQTIAAK